MMPRFKRIGFMVCLLGLIALTAFADETMTMSVQVKKGEVRSAPSFLGPVIARLSYGERVNVFEKKGAWLKVGWRGGSAEGWMHSTALTPKKIELKAGAQDVQASVSSNELALAGKGFNQQVEGQFKAKNPDIDFTWIDRMETFMVTEEQMQQFLQTGGLSPQGGL